MSRSTACVLHYLMSKKGMNLKDSFNLVKSKRKVASPTVGFFQDLIDLDFKLYGNKKPALNDEELSNIGIKAIICLLPKNAQIEHDPNKFIVLIQKIQYYVV